MTYVWHNVFSYLKVFIQQMFMTLCLQHSRVLFSSTFHLYGAGRQLINDCTRMYEENKEVLPSAAQARNSNLVALMCES